MANLPGATTSVSEQAGANGSGTDRVCVIAPVANDPDMQPRQYGNAAAVFAKHGYCEGVEYVDGHISRTKKPVIFVGAPIGTPGSISRERVSGNTGTCRTTITAGSDGIFAEHDGILEVVRGGIVGTDPITLRLSLDKGHTYKTVRLGYALSYTEPYHGFSVAFLSGGTLVAGDVIHEWHGSAPAIDYTDLAEIRANLAADDKLFRSVVVVGDMTADANCSAVVEFANAYESENDRYIYCRASTYPHREAFMSQSRVVMTGDPEITFAADGDTITRDAGSFVTDGFAVGMVVTITGATTSGNNLTNAPITAVTALEITLDASVVDDVDAAGVVSITGSYPITLSAVGAGTETVTRHASSGSFIADGFRVGDTLSLVHDTGTFGGAEGEYEITGVTATVLTVADPDANFAAGSYASYTASLSASQLLTDWIAEVDAEFEARHDQPRVDVAVGRRRVVSQFTGWNARRPASWSASWREYQHDLHIPVWRKSDGPLGGTLKNTDKITVEWDDRTGGGAASAAGFTSHRTWASGPEGGVFLAVSVTGAPEDQMRSYTHNMAVLNLAQSLVQRATENVAIGQSVILNADGTATKDSIRALEAPINAVLQNELLTNKFGEGQRASSVVCVIDPTTHYNVAEPTMVTTTEALLNGTVHSVSNTIRVARG